jgi:hypothetical protein
MSSSHENVLPTAQQGQLRAGGVIQSDEVAIQVGDLLVAENVVSRARRVITEGIPVNESPSRRVMRD